MGVLSVFQKLVSNLLLEQTIVLRGYVLDATLQALIPVCSFLIR